MINPILETKKYFEPKAYERPIETREYMIERLEDSYSAFIYDLSDAELEEQYKKHIQTEL